MKTQSENAKKTEAPELDTASLSAIRTLVNDDEMTDVVRSSDADRLNTSVRFQEPTVSARSLGRGAFPDLSQAESAQGKPSKRIALKLARWRPTSRVILFGALALLIAMRPWLVIGLIFLVVVIVLGVFFALGYDGFWQRIMALGRWYAGRRPERAVQLHARLDAIAMNWDAILDRFPEGTVDGLYLPDFGELAAAGARHDEVLDRRFDSLRNSEA